MTVYTPTKPCLGSGPGVYISSIFQNLSCISLSTHFSPRICRIYLRYLCDYTHCELLKYIVNIWKWRLYQRKWRLCGEWKRVWFTPPFWGEGDWGCEWEEGRMVIVMKVWMVLCRRHLADEWMRSYTKPEEYGIVNVPLPKLRDNDVLVSWYPVALPGWTQCMRET